MLRCARSRAVHAVIQGHKATAQQIEAFADRLAESIINGELHVGNWSSEKGAEINVSPRTSGGDSTLT